MKTLSPESFWTCYKAELRRVGSWSAYQSDTQWTIIAKQAAVAACQQLGLQASQEYFRLDVLGYDEQAGAKYDWNPRVAFEVENSAPDETYLHGPWTAYKLSPSREWVSVDIDVLKHLMEEYDLSGSDIGRIIGQRELGAKVLNGGAERRPINQQRTCQASGSALRFARGDIPPRLRFSLA